MRSLPGQTRNWSVCAICWKSIMQNIRKQWNCGLTGRSIIYGRMRCSRLFWICSPYILEIIRMIKPGTGCCVYQESVCIKRISRRLYMKIILPEKKSCHLMGKKKVCICVQEKRAVRYSRHLPESTVAAPFFLCLHGRLFRLP